MVVERVNLAQRRLTVCWVRVEVIKKEVQSHKPCPERTKAESECQPFPCHPDVHLRELPIQMPLGPPSPGV